MLIKYGRLWGTYIIPSYYKSLLVYLRPLQKVRYLELSSIFMFSIHTFLFPYSSITRSGIFSFIFFSRLSVLFISNLCVIWLTEPNYYAWYGSWEVMCVKWKKQTHNFVSSLRCTHKVYVIVIHVHWSLTKEHLRIPIVLLEIVSVNRYERTVQGWNWILPLSTIFVMNPGFPLTIIEFL